MIPPKKGQDRKATRPADIVFSDKMERTYATYLNLIAKVRSLATHRALKHDDSGQLVGRFNRFVIRVADELVACQVVPGQAIESETPSLGEFLKA